jgi:arylesterase/paraoxonase
MTWRKRIALTVLVIFLGLALLILDFLRHDGQFRDLAPHFAGRCRTLVLQASAEDIQIDRARGIAFLSYLDRRAAIEGRHALGTVMLLDLNVPDGRPRPALTVEPPDFRPQGLSLYRAGDGSQRLFAISHPRAGDAPGPNRVEIFEQGPTGAFAPVRTIEDPLLRHPNAILAVGPDQFYVANDSGAGNRLERGLERLFRRAISEVVFFDGRRMRSVAAGLESATGIGMSPDGSRVYVSEAFGNRVAIFAREPGSGDLRLLERVDLAAAPDNINVNADGTVWIAAHARGLALMRHLRDARLRAPTVVYRYVPDAKPAARLTEIYMNDGEEISAGSVGAPFGNQLLIGSLTERRLLVCRMP